MRDFDSQGIGPVSRRLPFKQRLIVDYKPKLKELVKAYPHLSYSLDDMTLAVNIADIFQKIGFIIHPQPKQDVKVLVKNIVTWLNNGYLVLLHFRPISSDFGLLELLRVVKKYVRQDALGNLIPIFIMSYTSQKQHSIFRRLGTFGINYASFLTPNAAVDANSEDLLNDLLSFGSFQKKNFSLLPDKGGRQDEDALKTIEKYKAYNSQGEELMEKGDYEEAIKQFSQAIALKPDFDSLMNRGDSYYHNKNYVPALFDYREAFKIKQSVPGPHARIGTCCFALIKETVKSGGSPEKAKNWSALGMKHLKDAKLLIDKMVMENKETPEELPKCPYAPIVNTLTEADIRGLGLKEIEIEVSELAEVVIRQTEKMDFLDSNADVDERIDQAILLARNKNYDLAEKIFRQVIQEDPSNVGPAFNNFAVELRKNNEVKKAFEIYLELLKHDIPDKGIVVENMKKAGADHALTLRDDFKQEEAISVYKELLANDPKGKEWILCDLAMTYLEMQNQAQASFRLMEAIYINPQLMNTKKFEPYKDLANLREEMMMKLAQATN